MPSFVQYGNINVEEMEKIYITISRAKHKHEIVKSKKLEVFILTQGIWLKNGRNLIVK